MLLERDGELEVLEGALDRAARAAGSVVLVSGEAGIGKTSLVRAFLRAAAHRATVLQGACDDLLSPRTLGPLRDAARTRGGPLAAALADGDRDAVLAAVLTELGGSRPTVLVLEDVHWADDATLDVLRYVGRRVDELAAVIVVTFRDGEVGRSLQRVLGGLGGPSVRRLALARLSRPAVARLAGGTAATSAPLFALTAGNPFFVSEVLATAADDVPATVVDAVLARVHRLTPETRDALEQLAVVPSAVSLPLARALLGDIVVLAEAERAQVLEVWPDAVAFRHELARRAVEGALPVSVRMRHNARVLAQLLAAEPVDLPRVAHHAVAAGDDAVVVAHAPRAAERRGGQSRSWPRTATRPGTRGRCVGTPCCSPASTATPRPCPSGRPPSASRNGSGRTRCSAGPGRSTAGPGSTSATTAGSTRWWRASRRRPPCRTTRTC